MSIEAIGNWVSEQEHYWDQIEEMDFQPVRLDGQHFDPFDHESINRHLLVYKLVYSAGYGRLGQPLFTLATLLNYRQSANIEAFDCDVELARGSVSVPAMSLGNHIVVKRAGVRDQIWNLYDEWMLRQNPGPMARVVKHFGFVKDESLEGKLKKAADELTPLFIAHEQGEVQASDTLGVRYARVTADMAGTVNEHYFRAVRDLLADTTETWPLISKQAKPHYLDFWLATASGIRLELLKETEIYQQLSTGSGTNQLIVLKQITATEQCRWRRVCKGLLSTFLQTDPRQQKSLNCRDIIAELLQ